MVSVAGNKIDGPYTRRNLDTNRLTVQNSLGRAEKWTSGSPCLRQRDVCEHEEWGGQVPVLQLLPKSVVGFEDVVAVQEQRILPPRRAQGICLDQSHGCEHPLTNHMAAAHRTSRAMGHRDLPSGCTSLLTREGGGKGGEDSTSVECLCLDSFLALWAVVPGPTTGR